MNIYNVPKGCTMSHSGLFVNVFKPTTDMFTIEDIAESIAYNYRWGGHSKSKITVAEHSVNVFNNTGNFDDALAALLHDASEGYMGDLASPIKRKMKLYTKVEAGVMVVIAEKFGFMWPLSNAVHRADRLELEREWNDCMLTNKSYSLPPEEAKQLWLTTYYKLAKLISA